MGPNLQLHYCPDASFKRTLGVRIFTTVNSVSIVSTQFFFTATFP